MEAVNDSSKLVAQAKDILETFNGQAWYEQLDDVIKLLEEALEKLSKAM